MKWYRGSASTNLTQQWRVATKMPSHILKQRRKKESLQCVAGNEFFPSKNIEECEGVATRHTQNSKTIGNNFNFRIDLLFPNKQITIKRYEY